MTEVGRPSSGSERGLLEAAPHQEEEHFKLLFEQAPLGYQSLDEDGRFLEVNSAWLDLLGYARCEVIGRSFADFLTPAGRPLFQERFPRFKELGKTHGVEFEMVRKDQTVILVSFEGRIARDDHGRFLRTHCILQDVTERRRAEKALRESELKYRVVAENTHDWEFWLDPEGRFLHVSPSCARITGYEPGSFLADPGLFLRIVHPHDQPDVARHLLAKKPASGELEFRIVRRDAEIRWISHVCQPVFDDQGRDLGSRGSNRDITDRKQSELLLVIERDLASALSRAKTAGEVLQTSLQAGIQARGGDGGGIYRVDADSGELRLEAHAGLSPKFVQHAARFGPGSVQNQVVARGELVEFDAGLLALPAFENVRREGIRSLAVVPVMHEGRAVACLNLASRTEARISAPVRHALEAMTSQMGIALARVDAEAALKRSEAELQATYDSSPIMMCVVDIHRSLLHMNRAMEEFLGRSEEQLRHQRAGTVIGCVNALEDSGGCGRGPACESCALRLALQDTFRTGKSHRDIECRMRLKCAGGDRDVILLVATALIRTGTASHLLICMNDVTQRRKAEEQLRLQAMVLNQIADRVTVTDLDGRITYVNDAQCQGSNRLREQLLGQAEGGGNPQQGFIPQEILQQTLQEGRWRGQVVKRLPDGEELILDCRTQPVVDDMGRVVAVCGVATDITERKRADAALRDRESLLTRAEEIAGMGSFIWDLTNDSLTWSNGMSRLCGLQDESTGTLPEIVARIVHPEDRQRLERQISRIVAARRFVPFEFRIVLPDGTVRIHESSGEFVLDEQGTPVRCVGVSLDITQRRAQEQRFAEVAWQLSHSSRLATLGELAAGIAHEVNQPLCAIVNFARACGNLAMSESPNPAQICDWSEAIASTAADAGDIIGRLLKFARRAQPERESVTIRQLVEDSALLVCHEARLGRVAIRPEVAEPDLFAYVQPVAIQQVLVNLLRNSIDALSAASAPEKQIVVRAHSQGDCVEFVVSDNGPGVPQGDRGRIFEPFFTTKPLGVGLGLAISRTIVEEHGGRIRAAVSETGGLAVHFTVPAGRG